MDALEGHNEFAFGIFFDKPHFQSKETKKEPKKQRKGSVTTEKESHMSTTPLLFIDSNNGVFNDRLVAMNAKNTTIGGDSGGGWSFNFTAYGSHKGGCTVGGILRNVFSVADLYDEALGVTVRTN